MNRRKYKKASAEKTEANLFINFVVHNSFRSLLEEFYDILSFVDIKRASPKQEEVKELFRMIREEI